VSYQIRVTARAARDLQRLPEKIVSACVEFIYGPLADNPQRVGKPLRGELTGQHSARRGEYRVIYIIGGQHVDIVHIAHRGDVYR
jgi:mRNA-degrading endonuclease RelE of RelBE toxin-antitoxin system